MFGSQSRSKVCLSMKPVEIEMNCSGNIHTGKLSFLIGCQTYLAANQNHKHLPNMKMIFLNGYKSLLTADFSFKTNMFRKFIQKYHQFRTIWIKIQPNTLDLICVQTVSKLFTRVISRQQKLSIACNEITNPEYIYISHESPGILTKFCYVRWALTPENLSSGVCEQQSRRRLCYLLIGKYHI